MTRAPEGPGRQEPPPAASQAPPPPVPALAPRRRRQARTQRAPQPAPIPPPDDVLEVWPFRSKVSPGPESAPRTAESGPPRIGEDREREDGSRPRWNFQEGYPILPGRLALKRLGGGTAYEVYLAWDEQLFALTVAKLLRPDRVADVHALRELRREAELLERLAHPLLVRGFGAVFDGPHPHILIEYAEGPTLRQVIEKHG